MLSKTPPVLPPHRFKQALRGNVAAVPLLVQEERTNFSIMEAHLSELRVRQNHIQGRVLGPRPAPRIRK